MCLCDIQMKAFVKTYIFSLSVSRSENPLGCECMQIRGALSSHLISLRPEAPRRQAATGTGSPSQLATQRPYTHHTTSPPPRGFFIDSLQPLISLCPDVNVVVRLSLDFFFFLLVFYYDGWNCVLIISRQI